MRKPRMTVTFKDDEFAAVRAAAEEIGLTVSAYVRLAARAEISRLRRERVIPSPSDDRSPHT